MTGNTTERQVAIMQASSAYVMTGGSLTMVADHSRTERASI